MMMAFAYLGEALSSYRWIADDIATVTRSLGLSFILFAWMCYMLKRLDEFRPINIVLLSAGFIYMLYPRFVDLRDQTPVVFSALFLAYPLGGLLGQAEAEREAKVRRERRPW